MLCRSGYVSTFRGGERQADEAHPEERELLAAVPASWHAGGARTGCQSGRTCELGFLPSTKGVGDGASVRIAVRADGVPRLDTTPTTLGPAVGRRAELNGDYGCMGDLGMHALHLPLRAGWMPLNVSAILSDVVTERPDGSGGWARCDTWDNALLLCEAGDGDVAFPLRIETKRIAPGETNTWATEIDGTQGSIAFSTKLPKALRFMDYRPGDARRG